MGQCGPRACFAHIRRRFYQLDVNESSRLATQTVTTLVGLWAIKADIRGQDSATQVEARQESLPPSSKRSSIYGRMSCLACPVNPNSPRRSAMPHPAAALMRGGHIERDSTPSIQPAPARRSMSAARRSGRRAVASAMGQLHPRQSSLCAGGNRG